MASRFRRRSSSIRSSTLTDLPFQRKAAKKEIQCKGDKGTGGDREIDWSMVPDSSPHLLLPPHTPSYTLQTSFCSLHRAFALSSWFTASSTPFTNAADSGLENRFA